jgi:protein-tyrosine phosphatase
VAGRRGLTGARVRRFVLGHSDQLGTLPAMRPPTWIVRDKLLAGRHPCAWSAEHAETELGVILDHGVTLILDLTQQGELTPYDALVPETVRVVRLEVRDFTPPTHDQIAFALDTIDAELERGGVVYVHCWAGCGRTGVVVGCWLVQHGMPPQDALARIAETRGLGCPQTLEQRLAILDWHAAR